MVSVPFAVDPTAAWAPFARLSELIGSPAADAMGWMQPVGAIASALALAALVPCAVAPRMRRPRTFEWIESGLILGLGLIADPLLAVGAYFLMVHGFRQSAALGGELASEREPSLGRRLAALHRAALPLLIPSWLALAVLILLIQPTAARDLAILSLAVYVVATPPHHLYHEVLR